MAHSTWEVPSVTSKVPMVLSTPPTVTFTIWSPAVAFCGTSKTISVSLQLVGDTAAPPKVTVEVPCESPKPDPVMVTEVPTGPESGLRVSSLTPWTVTVAS